jgi:hypothetical protein
MMRTKYRKRIESRERQVGKGFSPYTNPRVR